jgi:hypothetical protein
MEVYKKDTSEDSKFSCSNSTLQIVFGKRRQECTTLELRSLADMPTSLQGANFVSLSRAHLYLGATLLKKQMVAKAIQLPLRN